MNRTPLVGRSAELAALSGALDEARRGRGSVHVLAGDGGVGKTRLTAAVQEAAGTRGVTPVVGRAFPVEAGIPYALFADAFVPFLRAMPPATLQTLSRGGMAELSLLFPALDGSGAAPRVGNAAELRPRLLDTFAQLLQRLAKREPLLLVLENLQWADPSSFDLLHFVARTAPEHPLMLLCTYNEAQRDTNPSLLATEQSLRSLGVLQRHHLPPLAPEETAELLQRQFEVPAATVTEFARRLHERTRGNPFFIEETVKTLVQAGHLRREGDRWVGWETDALELPRSIRDALHARYLRLSEPAQDVVIAAAVVGTVTPHALFERLPHVAGEGLVPAVEELLRERILLESSAGGELSYEFAHPMMQEVLYAELSRARVRQLHGLIADALEAHYGARALERADALAVHFQRAESPAHAERACRYLAAAGRSALARGASREAVELLGAAHAIAERGDDAAAREGLLDLLARARSRTGDYAGAAALWSEALPRAQAVGDHARVALLERRLGEASLRRGEGEEAIRRHARALEAARRDGGDAVVASALLAHSRTLLEFGRGDEAERDLQEARGIAERLGEAPLLARVFQALQMLSIWRGPSADAREHGACALEFAIAAGDRQAEWSAHWAMAMHAAFTGDAAGTKRNLDAAERVAEELRSPLLRLWTAEVAIEYRSSVGEWDEALAIADRTIAEARAFGQRVLLPRLLVWSALMHLGRGEDAVGKARVDEAWALAGADRAAGRAAVNVHTVVPAHVGRAVWHLSRQEYGEALRVGEAGLAIADRTGYTAWAMHRLMPAVAEAALWLQDWERAARYGERLRQTAERLAHPLGLAWSDACFALIRMLQGDKAGAIAQLRHAADALDAIPFVEHAARLRRKLADSHNDSGDPRSAIPELRRCHDMFRALGARPALEEVREKMRALGAKPPPIVDSTGAGAGALTAREVAIARLVAQHKSNREIGEELDISPRTVSTHLSNIFQKLGIDSRGQLTDHVREQGW